MRNKFFIGLLGGVLFLNSLFIGAQSMSKKASAEEKLFSMQEILTPIWEGELSYQESALPVKDENGGVVPIRLLYPIEEIIEVKNAALTVTYEQGKDYVLSNGELLINPKGDIPMLTYEQMNPTFGKSGYEARDGGKVLHQEGSWFHSRQIVVTYRHKAEYTGYLPERQAERLSDLQEKLLRKEDIELFVFGDSISVGANSSGFKAINVSPYMPTYPELFVEGLKKTYGVGTVKLVNASVGGTASAWGVNTITSAMSGCADIDLAILAFGMNDIHTEPRDFAENMSGMAARIRMRFPDAAIIMIATMLPNYDAVNFYGNQPEFYSALKENCETDGTAIVNVTGVHAGLLERKNYADMTGNNINHPNDYLARVYAQSLLETLKGKNAQNSTSGEYKNSGCNATVAFGISGMMALFIGSMLTKKGKKDKRRFG